MNGPSVAPEFVSFHADRPAGTASVHPNASLASRGYMTMLDLLFRSARLFHPGAACTLLTDAATRVRGVSGRVRRLESAVDHGALMLSRTLAQAACVERSPFARPLVFLDSDILLRASLQPVFAEDFDVALTWRANKHMPINGGLLILHHRRPDASRRFFERFVALYRERYAADANAAWYGDQLALRDYIGMRHDQIAKVTTREIDGVRVRFLPCEEYNFSPDNTYAAIASGLPDKYVLHFKGQRKRLMTPFWETFLRPLTSRMPWVRWRADKARRELDDLVAAEQGSAAVAVADTDQEP